MPRPAEITAARTELGITQTQFGQLVDTALRTVQAWEAGDRNMPALKWRIIQEELKRQKK